MIDPTELAMLHAIADSTTDNLPRLVYADWLEEHGNPARAGFIRVQCELSSPNLTEPDRSKLLLRERDLLNIHRRDWCEVGGVALEDIEFDRGLILAARIKDWDGGAFLRADVAPYFLNVQELDLSGFMLDNIDVAEIAKTAELPMLRKLILSSNRIDDSGARRLASARLKRLETLYLFNSRVSPAARDALMTSSNFRLKTLDLGEREEGYSMSAGQAELGRRHFIRSRLLPHLDELYKKYPLIQSAMLCVAQYWNDEAEDAVQSNLVLSELYEPKLDGASYYYPEHGEEIPPDPNVPNTQIVGEHGESGSATTLWQIGWGSNNSAIPLWAAYTTEGGHQSYDALSEVYNPAVIFYRHGGYRFLPMFRPHLDGIRPEWEAED